MFTRVASAPGSRSVIPTLHRHRPRQPQSPHNKKEMADEVYTQLPQRTKQRIDDAFNSVLGDGGFVQGMETQTQIPFDLVPSALRRLDLPEDDDEILTVLRNAASGWKGGSTSEDKSLDGVGDGGYKLGVSLEDWRSVCSVLLEDADEEGSDDVDMEVGRGGFIREDEGMKGRSQRDYGGGGFIPEDDDEEDAYEDEEGGGESAEGEASDEDFLPGPRTRRTRATRNRSPESTATTPSKARRKPIAKDTDTTKLSAKQKQAAFDTFALFFPDVKEDELKAKRIMIKDVQRVAGLLKEKIKAEEASVVLLFRFTLASSPATPVPGVGRLS